MLFLSIRPISTAYHLLSGSRAARLLLNWLIDWLIDARGRRRRNRWRNSDSPCSLSVTVLTCEAVVTTTKVNLQGAGAYRGSLSHSLFRSQSSSPHRSSIVASQSNRSCIHRLNLAVNHKALKTALNLRGSPDGGDRWTWNLTDDQFRILFNLYLRPTTSSFVSPHSLYLPSIRLRFDGRLAYFFVDIVFTE